MNKENKEEEKEDKVKKDKDKDQYVMKNEKRTRRRKSGRIE